MRRGNRSAAAQKRWVRDSDKELYWRKTIADWKKSGLSIRAFCQKHDIVETSFYAWRREITIRDRETGKNTSSVDTDIPERVKDSKGRVIPVHFREHHQASREAKSVAAATSAPAFVQLKLAETVQKKQTDVEIVCPNGLIIRVGQDTDLELVSRIINTVE